MATRHGRTARTLADIVNLIISTRRARGLSQEQLAKRAGVSRAWLAAVEGGKARVDFSLILHTLAALDIQLTATAGKNPKPFDKKGSTAASPDDINKVITRALTRSS